MYLYLSLFLQHVCFSLQRSSFNQCVLRISRLTALVEQCSVFFGVISGVNHFMMVYRIVFLVVFLLGKSLSIENRINQIKPKQLLYAPDNRYSAGILDYNFLNPQQQTLIPQYNFADARNALPRFQPQFLFYGASPGQPFLLNPGQPPNNFLFPPPETPQGPGVIYRNAPQPQPGRPVFVGPGNAGGFPNQKPAFVPAIEKDAEEIPTNPSRIPPFKPKKPARKPEKVETFEDTPTATEADDLEGNQRPKAQPKTPKTNTLGPKPGHRYFFLNGQSLFNYPFSLYLPQNVNPEDVLRYSQNYPKSRPQEVPVPVIPAPQNPALQNPQFQAPNFQNPAVFDGSQSDQNRANGFPLNFDPYFQGNLQNVQPQIQYFQDNLPVSYLQPHVPAVQFNPNQNQQAAPLASSSQGQVYILNEKPNHQSVEGTKNDNENDQRQPPTTLLRSILPLSVTPKEGQNVQIRVSTKDFNLQPIKTQEYPQYLDDIENDSVIIDAKFDDDSKESEAISVPAKQPREPSLAQAEPGAIALAGVGGVAESGPRATALVGKDGMAVSSPKATAIAGPADNEEKEEEEQDSKKDPKKDKKEKYFRQRFRGIYI
ncbi:uncharacterized protein LOC123311264 [Coccinella septempunctata]|uniref:uncharacterized protein LOC123311264 n=1 Tax=Coccinella septempunctata TaxID=41139 RepID=UPI001D066A75|nr:uncharacterized protein LOC123311264 [Coccinella septempunctata]